MAEKEVSNTVKRAQELWAQRLRPEQGFGFIYADLDGVSQQGFEGFDEDIVRIREEIETALAAEGYRIEEAQMREAFVEALTASRIHASPQGPNLPHGYVTWEAA